MVLPEEVPFPHSGGIGGTKREEKPSSTGETSHSLIARPYQPPVPFPQRLAWTKLSQLEPRFARFLDILCQIYVSNPFLNALKEAHSHLKFLRKLLAKKGEPEKASVALIGESYSTLLQRWSPSKLQDPSSFSTPCYIRDIKIERALCDLGASVSLVPLPLCQKLHLLGLKLIDITIQLAYYSTR